MFHTKSLIFRFLVILGLTVAAAMPLSAWKVMTHAYLAFAARADALNDGKVVIYLADHDAGRFVLDASGRPVEIGRYEVDPRVLRILGQYPEFFRAGVIGTDVFPDLLTAQSIVHPDNGPLGRTVSDEWLSLVWSEALKTNSDKALAFALGYLAHGAGDLYGHTFINEYAGGPFKLGINALKHYVLESYLDLRTPRGPDFFNVSIAGIEPFIYRTLVANDLVWRTGRDTIAEAIMMNGAPPRLFQALKEKLAVGLGIARTTLQQMDKDDPARIRSLTSEAAKCLTSDPTRSARLTAEATALSAEYSALKIAAKAGIAYVSAWIKDIDSGLRAWPEFGRRLAQTLFFTQVSDKEAALDAAEDFMNAHGLSMCGLPDALGETLAWNKKIYEMIPKDIRDAIDFFKTDPTLYLIGKAWGLTWDLIKNPAVHFDVVMNDANPGRKTTLAQFNREVLQIRDVGNTTNETCDWEKIPAMVNTVTMTKLSWLSPGGLQAFLRDLEDRGYTSNTMTPLVAPPMDGRPLIVGFMKSLDHDNQWCEDPKLLFVRDPCVYRKLFLKQIGEDEPGCLTGCDTPPDGSVVAGPVESPLAPGFVGLDMAKGTDGRVYRWGKAFIVATAGGPIAYRPYASPEVVTAIPPAASLVVHSPEDKVVVLARDGTLWTWGFGAHAQAGILGTKDPFEPLQIPNMQSIVQLAAGSRHVLALRSNGQVWVWGANNQGVLGLGVRWTPPRPRRVPGLSGVKRVAAGNYFSAAVTMDGAVWAWGGNDSFQLGDGTREERNAPVRVAGLSEVQDLALGTAHCLALKMDGTVWAWGKDYLGQLGDGKDSDRPNPALVPGLSGVTAVAAGGFQSVALRSDGSVWVWGEHYMDGLGTSDKARCSSVPVQVPGLPPIVAVACGESHTTVLDRDGAVWTWGSKNMARKPVKVPGISLK